MYIDRPEMLTGTTPECRLPSFGSRKIAQMSETEFEPNSEVEDGMLLLLTVDHVAGS